MTRTRNLVKQIVFVSTFGLLAVASFGLARPQGVIDWQVTTVIKDASGKVVLAQTSRSVNGRTVEYDHRTTYPLGQGRSTWVGLHSVITPSGSTSLVQLTYDIDYQYTSNGQDPTMDNLPQDVHLNSVYSIPPGVLTEIGGDALSRSVYVQANVVSP